MTVPFLAQNQKWKGNGSLLANGDGRWISSHNWTLPSINTTGIIRNADTGKVLGIASDEIKVEEQNLDNSSGQIWKIALVDQSYCGLQGCYYDVTGYFNIINPASGKLLTALAAFDLRILGIKEHFF